MGVMTSLIVVRAPSPRAMRPARSRWNARGKPACTISTESAPNQRTGQTATVFCAGSNVKTPKLDAPSRRAVAIASSCQYGDVPPTAGSVPRGAASWRSTTAPPRTIRRTTLSPTNAMLRPVCDVPSGASGAGAPSAA